MTMQLHTYIKFHGNCAEALKCYEECFSGKIISIQTYKEFGYPVENAEDSSKIIHSTFQLNSMFLFMACDDLQPTKDLPINGISLSINFDNAADQENVYNKLSKHGTVIMPLQKAQWGAMFAIIKDKFGIEWLLHFDSEQKFDSSKA
jgi:PhnB protein